MPCAEQRRARARASIAPGSEPPWRRRSWTVSAPTITASGEQPRRPRSRPAAARGRSSGPSGLSAARALVAPGRAAAALRPRLSARPGRRRALRRVPGSPPVLVTAPRAERALSSRAAASGSAASAIARSTTTRPPPACDHLADVAGVQAADREERHARVRRRVADQLQTRPPGGPAWSASRARARRRCSRPAPGRPRRSRPGRGWRGRSASPGRRARAPPRTGMSSWPTWTPSAPTSAATSGRSLTMKQRADPPHRARARVGDRRQLVVGEVLLAQLDDVDAAGDRGAEQVGQLAPARGALRPAIRAHQVQARAPQARARRSAPAASAGHRPKSRTEAPAARLAGRRSRTSISRMASEGAPDLLVVGGGVIGLAVAWRAARARDVRHAARARRARRRHLARRRGHARARSPRSSSATPAGACSSSALRSAELWPGLRRRARAPRRRRDRAAPDRHAAARPRRRRGARARAPARVPPLAGPATCDRLRPSEARELEPALAPTAARGARGARTTTRSTRGRSCAALRAACAAAGVQLREHRPLAGARARRAARA